MILQDEEVVLIAAEITETLYPT